MLGGNWCCYSSSPSVLQYSFISIPSSRKFQFCPPPPKSFTSSSPKILSNDVITWEDVAIDQLSRTTTHHEQNYYSSDLLGFFDKVKLCNRNSEKLLAEFIPFVVEDQIVGYVHNRFSHHLRRYKEVFRFPKDPLYGSKFGCHLALDPLLREPEDRTKAVGDVIKCLANQELITGTRNELYNVATSFGAPEFFSLERAAAPYFGIKAYEVHMNGYVVIDGQKYLWIAKRSKFKATYPGKLDHLVGGGLPRGISCWENLLKECEEEAGIPRSISSKAKPVGALSYMGIDGYKLMRDVVFCYDLKLPEDFVPTNEDGEVESFELVSVTHVANIIRNTHLFKDNCNLTIIDFLFRHGYLDHEGPGYLELMRGLRIGN